jgi:hypothetical protein
MLPTPLRGGVLDYAPKIFLDDQPNDCEALLLLTSAARRFSR